MSHSLTTLNLTPYLDWRARTLLEKLQDLLAKPSPELMVPIYEDGIEAHAIGTTLRSFGIDCFNTYVQDKAKYLTIARQVTMEYAMEQGMQK